MGSDSHLVMVDIWFTADACDYPDYRVYRDIHIEKRPAPGVAGNAERFTQPTEGGSLRPDSDPTPPQAPVSTP